MASKEQIISEIAKEHPHLRHDVAAKHGGVLHDLKCKMCGHSLPQTFLGVSSHRDARIEDEYKHLSCPKCACKSWEGKPSPRPSGAQLQDALATKAKLQSEINAREAKKIDAQIKELQEKKAALVGEAK